MSPMHMFDLSHPLESEMSIYPDDPTFTLCSHCTVQEDGYSVQSITLGSHTGTHVDAPSHFVSSGLSIDAVPISSFVGKAFVIDVSRKKEREKITWTEDVLPYATRMRSDVVVLFRTGWDRYWKTPHYLNHPFLERDVASRLVELGIRRIGIDALSPDETGSSGENFGVHEVILGEGGLIIENLRSLESIRDGAMVSFVPLNLKGGDGSPVRAYAWTP